MQQFCHLLLDIDQNSPDAEVDWNGFLKHVSKIVEMERKEYDPINALSNRRLLRKLTHPQQVGLEHLRTSIEEWEASTRRNQEG